MMSIPKVCVLAVALAVLSLSPASAGRLLDEGKLDTAWFGDDREFRKADEIDYLWVKPGFSLSGKKVQFAEWSEPSSWARRPASATPRTSAWPGTSPATCRRSSPRPSATDSRARSRSSSRGATCKVVGRIVDCTEGSAAAKFWVGMGAGSGSTTFDMKFVDAKSGELVAAIHHRVVSGSNLSTTDSKFVKWVDEFAERAGEEGPRGALQLGQESQGLIRQRGRPEVTFSGAGRTPALSSTRPRRAACARGRAPSRPAPG